VRGGARGVHAGCTGVHGHAGMRNQVRVGLKVGVPLEVDSPEARRRSPRWSGGGQTYGRYGGLLSGGSRISGSTQWISGNNRVLRGVPLRLGVWPASPGFCGLLGGFPDPVVNSGPALAERLARFIQSQLKWRG